MPSEPANNGFAADTKIWTENQGLIPICRLKLGQRVITFTEVERLRPKVSGHSQRESTIDASTWKVVHVLMNQDDDELRCSLLRGPDWFKQVQPCVDRTVNLQATGMGLSGKAKIVDIGECPTIEVGSGRVITATICQSDQELRVLYLDRTKQCIRVVAQHAICNATYPSWVSSDDSRFKTVRTIDGRFASVLGNDEVQYGPAYNVEVDGDHVYRVGKLGVLMLDGNEACRREIERNADK